jgi:hypothetical protein
MKPFLEIPVGVANTEKEEKQTIARIQPDNIEYYYPGFYQGTVIVMKSGNSMFSTLTESELDAGLSLYHDKTKAYTGKFGNFKLNTKNQTQP